MPNKGGNFRAKEYLEALNIGARCANCGNDNLRVLQWAHKDPAEKLFTISNSWRYYSLPKVAAEVGKCVRLCCNCHLLADAGELDISRLK